MLINTQVVEVNTTTRFMNYSTTVDLTDKSNVFIVLNSDNGTQIIANIECSIDGETWTLFGDFFDIVLIPHKNKVIEIPNEHVFKLSFIRISFRIKDIFVQNSSVTMSVYNAAEPATEVYLDGSSFVHITGTTTTVAKTGPGTLHSFLLNTSGLLPSTATLYDNTSGSGTVIAVVDTTSTAKLPMTLMYNIAFTTGLTIVTTGGAVDLTVTYR